MVGYQNGGGAIASGAIALASLQQLLRVLTKVCVVTADAPLQVHKPRTEPCRRPPPFVLSVQLERLRFLAPSN